MKQRGFVDALDRLLSVLPISERRDVLYDYEEHIRMAMENGKTEEEAVAALGTPKSIAKEILAEYYVNTARQHRTPANVLRAVVATVSLGFFNIIVVLGPCIVCVAVCISLFAAAAALVLSPVSGVAILATGATRSPWTVIWSMCIVEGVGLLLLVGCFSLAKWFGVALVKYLRFNIRIVKGVGPGAR